MLNPSSLNAIRLSKALKHLQVKAPLAGLTLAFLITGVGCGKRKPPLPPVERVLQRVDISALQRGDRVILTWRMPARNAGSGSIRNISRADVYRLAEPLNSPLALSEEEFSSRSTLIASVKIEESDFGLKPMSFTDKLEFAGQPVRLRYALRLVNASGQKAGYSNFLIVEPAANIASNPTDLKTEVRQEAIKLSWTPPAGNISGTAPLNLLGYNVYRSNSEKEPAKLLNKTPVNETSFSDRLFQFDKNYFYFVRSVSVGDEGAPTESLESNIVEVTPKDIFPPSAPDAITLGATPTSISIFFANNPETDVAGYRIYRSVDPNIDKANWTLLTKDPLTTNTFQDTTVKSGETYHYYLTAIDKAGNVSQPSVVVSENVP
jgi:hypothetical protein